MTNVSLEGGAASNTVTDNTADDNGDRGIALIYANRNTVR